MSRQIYIVYETDQWHSTATREAMGAFTSKRAAINAIIKYHGIPLKELFDDDEPMTHKQMVKEARRLLRDELELAYQTQGYSVNYDIEVWEQNEWLRNL